MFNIALTNVNDYKWYQSIVNCKLMLTNLFKEQDSIVKILNKYIFVDKISWKLN